MGAEQGMRQFPETGQKALVFKSKFCNALIEVSIIELDEENLDAKKIYWISFSLLTNGNKLMASNWN